MDWTQHLIVLPVLLPLLCAALLIPVDERRHRLKFSINMASVAALLAIAIALIIRADGADGPQVYLVANWAAPFGITLLVDRLSAMMLLLTGILAGAALIYAAQRWSRIGVHFHSLFQFLLMGINGAFLTHDLFNLFVFFEVMLAASYGLVLHGYNAGRIRAGLEFIAVNLAASLVFLIGLALIYGASGTLNLSDLAQRVAHLGEIDLVLLKAGMAALAIAFLVKGAMWPLGFWLPTTYAAASPPVAAMLVLTTKMGVYAVLRVWTLVFSEAAGEASGFGYELLLYGGMVTIAFGAAGMLATDTAGRMAGYAAIISSGTLLAAIGYGNAQLVTAALYYLVASTIAVGTFMLLIELIERIRSPGAAVLALTVEAFAIEETPEEPIGVGIPAALAFLGLAFTGCALIITGLPPLAGFIGKFSLIHSLLGSGEAESIAGVAWVLIALLVFSGFAAIIALLRFGVRTFWAMGRVMPPRLQLTEAAPVGALLLIALVLTVSAGPAFEYLGRASEELHQTGRYVEAVLSAPTVPSPAYGREAM
ncbi:MAG: monovalent cation/H+ antiporter subunit D [Gammaproteobacteria bacterium]|jgi:multicomponent K+:H+ antiporter subunit D|nr:monovalent cation/H+ antiporter subunit D [Gammaproteobacteria bacterium]